MVMIIYSCLVFLLLFVIALSFSEEACVQQQRGGY